MNGSETPEGGAPAPAARRTPYELVFAIGDFEARVFPEIEAEATARAVDPRHPERFAFLSKAADAIRAVVPAEAGPEALEQYRALFYHAFNFWRFGKRMYVLEPALARYLVEAGPRLEGWDLVLPHPALYLQLPPNLFWGSIAPDSTPEPVDGFFVTAAEAEDARGEPYRQLQVLVVLGIRRDRAGFSVIPFVTEAGPGIPQVWAEAPGRDAGSDFENVLPGGELSGLYSILTTTEVLKLLARSLWYADAFPADVEPVRGPAQPGASRGDEPPHPRIVYHRITLGERGGEEEAS